MVLATGPNGAASQFAVQRAASQQSAASAGASTRPLSGTADCTKDLLPPDEGPRFFAIDPDNFGPMGSDTARWYACFLRAMGEAPLLEQVHERETLAFRLLVLPILRPPFMVRLTVAPNGTGQLTTKGGESPKNAAALSLLREDKVSKGEVDRFLQLLDDANFWSMQTNQFYTKEQIAMARTTRLKRVKAAKQIYGGVYWVLEGAEGDKYHVVSRNLPVPGPPISQDLGPYTELTSYLFRGLAKLEAPAVSTPGVKR